MQNDLFTNELSTLLVDYIENNVYADKVLAYFFRHNKEYSVGKKAYITRSFYDILRNQRLLLAAIGEEKNGLTAENCDNVIYAWQVLKGEEKNQEIKQKLEEFSLVPKYRFSVPDWIDTIGVATFGAENWTKTIENLHNPSQIYIRANTIKINRDTLQKALKSENIASKKVEDSENGLEITSDSNLFASNSFQEGYFEIQDIASQMVAEICDVKPGMRISDACAGAGGKSLHLAALMSNRGKIVALDTIDWKLTELQNRASRAGATCIETRHINTTKVVKRLVDSFERVLLDVPCTGTGIWKRNPDSKYRLKEERFANLLKIQEEILERYSKMVKPNGKLIYSTCSVFPQEGEEQIRKFVASHLEWEIETEKRISPEKYDGFYMVRLVRKG